MGGWPQEPTAPHRSELGGERILYLVVVIKNEYLLWLRVVGDFLGGEFGRGRLVVPLKKGAGHPFRFNSFFP